MMKKFIIKTLSFAVIAFALFLVLLSQADGYTDQSYVKFTTPPQENLIMGTSRAAMGLQPAVFDSLMNIKIQNYAFTVGTSSYGEVYLNSIRKKVKEGTTSGLFVLTVDPWSISSKAKDPNDPKLFNELDGRVAKTPYVNQNPNLIYLLRNLKGEYYKTVLNLSASKFLYKKGWFESSLFLHKDGWLEASLSMDAAKVVERKNKGIEEYRKTNLPIFKYSSVRFDYLKQTINFLNKHGKVYLVRLPIHPEMMEIENELMPDFNTIMEGIESMTAGYFDMTSKNDQYQYIDGHHLFKDSGKLVTGEIVEWIGKMN